MQVMISMSDRALEPFHSVGRCAQHIPRQRARGNVKKTTYLQWRETMEVAQYCTSRFQLQDSMSASRQLGHSSRSRPSPIVTLRSEILFQSRPDLSMYQKIPAATPPTCPALSVVPPRRKKAEYKSYPTMPPTHSHAGTGTMKNSKKVVRGYAAAKKAIVP